MNVCVDKFSLDLVSYPICLSFRVHKYGNIIYSLYFNISRQVLTRGNCSLLHLLACMQSNTSKLNSIIAVLI